ncbi:DNA-binding transcriptional LysR family regulator [Kitasatospora sp. MAA4]|uniref:LysR family transcriptional regulator n=1 Tax=Kitasatospora sp. MAA4 TaxID=3035093 RepID=UPI0024763B79|nr:LysR family transcriptional regulator [Kitasatospora sp. MAA4]MDH6135563.1 DNA-binding transcriptional LysR family regulator [Kitasatospora sp. MAA4]
MELDPRRLLVLDAVARSGGIAAAARRLGVTASAVSQALARLEQQAGLALLDRAGNRLELTEAGRALAARGARIADELTGAAQDLAVHGRIAGRVAIGVSLGVLTATATAVIPLLAAEHPLLEAELREVEYPAALQQLRRGLLDVVVLTADRDHPTPLPDGTACGVVMTDGYRLVVPESWSPVPSSAAELAGLAWISAPPDSARGHAFARFAAQYGIRPAREHLAVSSAALRAMLAAQLGAAVLPANAAARLRCRTVTALPVSGTYESRVLYRTSPVGPSPAVGAVLRALRQAVLGAAEALAVREVLDREPIVGLPFWVDEGQGGVREE